MHADPFINAKIGRNDPCWCGSGEKYKRCHLGREQLTPANPWQTAKEIQKARSLRMCLHPEATTSQCGTEIVRAHSVQESVLRMIATDGHVYAWNHHAAAMLKNNGSTSLARVGVNQASTFTGMCGPHDDEAFAPVEKRVFSATPEQCFLLAYRAICREVFVRRARPAVADVIRTLDRGRTLRAQLEIQAVASAFAHGSQLGSDDLDWHKIQYDKALTERNFGELKYLVIWLKDVPDVMCSGLTYPEFDFDGNELQRLDSPQRLDLLTFSSIGGGNRGALVFSWLGNSNTACLRLVDSLLRMPQALIPHAFVRFVFGFCENVFIAPRWWESLSQEDREGLRQRMQTEASFDQAPSPTSLADDRRRVVNWQIESIVRGFDA
jgi:hypothetical protein